jgi:glycosyltransferase involved in cell wall biosynthesis
MPETHRILQIFNRYLETGGEEASVQRVFNSLQSITETRQCLFDSADWTGHKAPGKISQAARMFYNPDSIRKVRKNHTEHNASIWLLHNLFPVASAGIYREANRLDVPLIQYIHNFRPFSVNGYLWVNGIVEPSGLRKNFWPEIRAGSWQNSRMKTLWYAGILKYLHTTGAFNRVQAWVAISDFMRQTFIKAGVPEDRVFHIPHSWEIQHPKVETPTDDSYYLFLGRLSDMKGIPTLFKVWEILEKKLKSKTPALVIGGDGPLQSAVKGYCADHPHVKFVGKLSGDSKTNVIKSSRALIAPSVWWEPLGLVTYEAYEHQKPMFAAASGGLTETVQHESTGYLHEPGNVDELVEQILHLEANPELGPVLGNNGRVWLETHTGKDKWVKQFQAVLSIL